MEGVKILSECTGMANREEWEVKSFYLLLLFTGMANREEWEVKSFYRSRESG